MGNLRKANLERFNEWWFTGRVRKELALEFKRYALARLLESLRERQVLVVTGLRRVGKTTLFYQTIEKLLESVNPKVILYFSFDEQEADIKEVLEVYEKEVLSKPFEEAGNVFVFLDEVQYAKSWHGVVKQFYDLYPKIKFFISGSSSLLLSRGALEKLAGRFFLFELKPLTFFEFLEMKGVTLSDTDTDLFSRRTMAYFFDYLRRAGFPEIVDFKEEKISEYVRSSVLDRIIFKDIPALLRTREVILVEKIAKLIFLNPGMIVNTNSLAKNLGASKITVSNYLRVLEASLVLRSLGNFRPTFLSSSRKLKKYYPATTSMAYSFSGFDADLGKILETYAVNALEAELYFRSNGSEVDIVLQKGKTTVLVEVKEKASDEDVKKLLKIRQSLGSGKAVMLTTAEAAEKKGEALVFPIHLTEKLEKLQPL